MRIIFKSKPMIKTTIPTLKPLTTRICTVPERIIKLLTNGGMLLLSLWWTILTTGCCCKRWIRKLYLLLVICPCRIYILYSKSTGNSCCYNTVYLFNQ